MVSKGMYQHGQAIPTTALVERVYPFGVFVRLQNGARGYIRRRELSLSGDVYPSDVVSRGDEVQAVIVRPAAPGRLAELSVRAALPDPWQDFVRQFKVGNIVKARVKGLLPTGAFAQIAPGIDGFVPLKELATWEVEKPGDVVWSGDYIEAIIVYIDVARRKVGLSIRRRMERLARVESIMEALYGENRVQATATSWMLEGQHPTKEEVVSELAQAGPVLVVEDDDAVREPLVKWLKSHSCVTYGAKSAQAALDLCRNRKCGLILVDLNLSVKPSEMNGLDFIRELRKRKLFVPVAVMSSPDWLQERLTEIQELETVTVFPKPLDMKEIERLLVQLAKGESPKLQVTRVVSSKQHFREGNLAAIMRSGQPLVMRLQQGLKQLVEDTQAEKGIVFHLNPVSHQVFIVAQAGTIPLNEDAVYSLVESPVKDVIREGGGIWENRVSRVPTGRFRKLLDLLPFESCIGIPIEAGGQVEYALFLFHREANAFSPYRLRDAQAMATLFAVALESHALDRIIQDRGRLFLSGHLAAAFGHEVYNKLSGLDLWLRNLQTDFERWRQKDPGQCNSADVLEMGQALDRAVNTTVDLKQTVTDFRRLMETSQDETADVNQAIQRAEALIQPLARRAKVTLRLDLAKDLPLARGNPIALQQTFLNLMLNAVQHMENKLDGLRVLEVITTCETEDRECPIKARVSDTGSGIHRRLWDRIFALGFTSKPGGSGLGLYIARSLVESMGGRVLVEESLIPLGTTFLVELPAAQKT